jgi:large subunit ribosomal protein L4
MKLAVLNEYGKELRKLEVDDSVFGIEPNMAVLHQAYVTQRNNNRSGTHKTKSRGEVQGSTRKIRSQKGTGRARAGSNRSPTRVGGGVAFGPRPRSYARDLPKKMRRLAIRSALSGKVADGQLVVIDQLAMETPKTKEIIRVLSAIGFERSALLVTGSPDKMVTASVRNLERTKALPAAYLNVMDMLNHAGLVMTEDAIRVAEGLWGQKDRAGGTPIAARRHSETIAVPKPKPAPRQKRAAAKVEEPEAAPVAEAEETAAPAAEAQVAEAPKPKRARAPKAEKAAEAPAAEASSKEAPKPKRTRAPKAEAPTPEASAEEAPKPKRARAPKAEASAKKPAKGAEEAPKPKRAPRAKKKTEGAE